MKQTEIKGGNCSGLFQNIRIACRALIIENEKILLSCEKENDLYMIPGGGMEEGEDPHTCAMRKVSEETGYTVELSECFIEIDEYYQNWKYITYYYPARIIGSCERRLTESEKERGLTPVFIPFNTAMEIFSSYKAYADTDEEKHGIYLREWTALNALFKEVRE